MKTSIIIYNSAGPLKTTTRLITATLILDHQLHAFSLIKLFNIITT